MNNQDLINQMNWMNTQNAINSTLYYASEECASRPMTEAETMVFITFTGFLVLITVGILIWGFMAE